MSKTIRVATNPFRAVDADGNPCFVVQLDPFDPRYPTDARGWRGHVGARIAATALERPGSEAFMRSSRHSVRWAFQREAFEVPATDYYKRAVADGDLLPADAATASACRVPLRDVEDVRDETQRATGAGPALWIDSPGAEPATPAADSDAGTDEVK